MTQFYTNYFMGHITIIKSHTFRGHSSGIFDLKPIGDTEVVSAGGDGQVVRWNLQTGEDGKVMAKVNSTIYAICVDNERLLVGENSKAIHLIDTTTNQVLRSIEIKSPIFSILRSGDSYLVGTGAGELFQFDLSLNLKTKLRLATKSLRSISQNATDLALGYSDNTIRILDRITLEEKYVLQGHSLSVFAAEFNPSDSALISTGRDAQIKIWDTFNHFEELKSIPAHMYASNHIAFHPSGKYFATGSMDKTIKIWDASNFELLKVIDKARYDGHTNSVNKLLWVPFENLLVTCSDDRTIAVWDIKFD